MSESLLDLKKRINSTKKTGHITNAMRMISASKLTKIEKKSDSYQIYENKIKDIISNLLSSETLKDVESSDGTAVSDSNSLSLKNLLGKREIRNTAFLVITSDHGLVGGYNSNVIKGTLDVFEKKYANTDKEPMIIAAGSTGGEFFRKRGYNVIYEFDDIDDIPNLKSVQPAVSEIMDMYKDEKFDELYVCHNHHVNSLRSDFKNEKLLPLTDIVDQSEKHQEETDTVEYTFDPSPDVVLQEILPQFIESVIFGSIMDAKTAEHASSMTAMKSSTDNANDMVDELTVKFNRARQAQITGEISEISGGAAALEDN